MKTCPFGVECDDCRFFRSWILTNDRGEQKVEERCGLEVLMDEIPKIRGSVDGCQAASNETRNLVEKRTVQFVDTLKFIGGMGNGRSGGSSERDQIGEGEKPAICGGDRAADQGLQ